MHNLRTRTRPRYLFILYTRSSPTQGVPRRSVETDYSVFRFIALKPEVHSRPLNFALGLGTQTFLRAILLSTYIPFELGLGLRVGLGIS